MNPRYRRLLIPGLLGALLVIVIVSALVQKADAAQPPSGAVSRIRDARITESSGLAVSRAHADLVYTINDSGNAPIVYAVRLSTGQVVGTTRVDGGALVDTEALAIDGDGTLWVADTGDNRGHRRDVALYAFPEQGLGEHEVTARRYPVTYQGGPVDVETLLVDPRTDAKLLVSKQLLGGDVFALPDELTAGADNLATPVGADVPLLVTDGAFTPDGGRVVLRTYTAMHELDPAGWSAVATQRLPDQKQGESLAVEAGGRSVLVGSEGDDSALLRVPLPATAVPTTSPSSQPPAPSAARSSGPAPSSDGFRKPGASGFAGASFVYAALAVLLLVGLLALLTRRRPR